MFNTAHDAIENHPNIEKVVIMEHAPRHDVNDVDPLKLKPTLARYANNIFNQLWLDSKHKDKIVVGQHSLGNNVHDDNYKDRRTSKYDGVHFYGYYGRANYTKSVRSILQKAVSSTPDRHHQDFQESPSFHQQCPQTVFQKKKKQTTTQRPHLNTIYQHSVKDSNRFSVFNSNSGNQ